MSISKDEGEVIWDQFLSRWPLESLGQMTLEEYSKAKDPDCFTYGWLEKNTEKLGSIWGGSAFKFGVYSRYDHSEKEDFEGRSYADNYAWYSKYGNSAKTAFTNVLSEIIKVATAARRGDLLVIDEAMLGEVFKWKIAFLYQDRENPTIVPLYKADYLRVAANSSEKTISSLQKIIMLKRLGKPVLEYGNELWTSVKNRLSTELTPVDAQTYLNENTEKLTPIKPPTKKIAGYKTNNRNYHLALALDNTNTTLYFQEGDWIKSVKEPLKEIIQYSSQKSRSSNLAANAPNLASGHAIVKVVVPTKAALIELCDAYANDDLVMTQANIQFSNSEGLTMTPLNQILYGPPGTGKTFATIDESLRILDPAFLEANQKDRVKIKAKFDELTSSGLVRFVTFHQSFSYEDFVEGLRAVTNDDKQLEYKVESGVFKRLCEDARTEGAQSSTGIRSNPRIWKISINGAGTSETLSYCLKHGEARIGWGRTGDLRKLQKDNVYYESVGSGDRGTLRYFAEEIVRGDILLCIHSSELISAVGVVTSDYEYNNDVPSEVIADYNHCRSVTWLYTDLKLSIFPLNDNKQLTAKTVYPMDRFSWGDLLAYLEQSGAKPTETYNTVLERKPHVLIIDEINRGNISRIFGELITLIEPSKRYGEDEALELTLPYSKKPFSVPSNVYLIGTMNSADRSLTGLDIALRRRFTFKEMVPNPGLLDEINIEGVNIGEVLRKMNERIEVLLDREHCLGHAYFMPLREKDSIDELSFIFRQQILPLLQEYFFEDWERIAWVLNSQDRVDDQSFVQKINTDLSKLFGENVASNLQNHDNRWRINDAAFTNIECYRYIIGEST